jgi:hypothetical protein
MWPFVVKSFADAGYQGARAAVAVASTGSWVVEIVKRTKLHSWPMAASRDKRGTRLRTSIAASQRRGPRSTK